MRKALSAPVTVALLKGRANYVCPFHLARTAEYGGMESRADTYYLREIVRFAKVTETGDKSDLPTVPETAAIWNQVTSTKENCQGTECPHYQDCFVMKARKAAQQADVVVVNHHLFFADVVLKDTGVAELLPTANTVIFDEAHQLPDTATTFFGEFVSTARIHELCRDTQVEGLSKARDGADWVALVGALDKAVKDLRLTLPEGTNRMALHQIAKQEAFMAAVETFIGALASLDEVLQAQAERSEVLATCQTRTADMETFVRRWLALARGEEKTDDVLWVETFGLSMQLHLTPLSVGRGVPQAAGRNAACMDFHVWRRWRSNRISVIFHRAWGWMTRSRKPGRVRSITVKTPCCMCRRRCLCRSRRIIRMRWWMPPCR